MFQGEGRSEGRENKALINVSDGERSGEEKGEMTGGFHDAFILSKEEGEGSVWP